MGLVLVLATTYLTGQVLGALGQWASLLNLDVTPTLIVWTMLGAALALVGKSFCSAYLNIRLFRFLATRDASIASGLTQQLMAQPLVFIQRRSSQATAYALSLGITSAVLGLLGSSVIAVSESILLVVLTIRLFVFDPLVATYTSLFFVVVGVLLYKALSGWASRIGQENANLTILNTQIIQEGLRAYREISVGGRRAFYVDNYKDVRSRAARTQAHIQLLALVSKYVFEIALVVGGITLVLTQVARQDLTSAIAVIVVFLLAASRMMPSLLRIQNAVVTIRQSASQAEPALTLAAELRGSHAPCLPDADTSVRRTIQGMESQYAGFTPTLELENVSFTYPASADAAVVDISLAIESGQNVALIGPSGAGKSTLVDLMLGLLQPDSGTLSLGGHQPTHALDEHPGAVAYMPQYVALSPETIRANVAFGLPRESVDDDSVWRALGQAHIDEFLRSLPRGLDTPVGEHGFSLSGGQRQRLGLAKALYTQPRLLVLDEATSALDAETEHEITQSLNELKGTMTLIVIAHRLATVRHADNVFFMENGALVSSGTFEEVRKKVPQLEKQASLLGM